MKEYLPYVDNFFSVNNTKEQYNLQLAFKKNYILKFTYKLNTKNKPLFLDVLIDTNKNTYTTSSFNNLLAQIHVDYKSKCPKQYKIAII